MRKRGAQNSILFVALILLIFGLFPASINPQTTIQRPRPKLVVILVIDQFRYDYLERFRSRFVERGFNLLLKSGANFVNCRFDYACTETAVGHASIFTGAYGNVHGIVGNGWYDRAAKQPVNSVKDPATTLVGGRGGLGVSPRRLLGSTIGDELRMATNFRAKVISISLKDRAAVLSGGHAANAAYWAAPQPGQFVTSTYYLQSLPAWVVSFDQRSGAKDFCGKTWEALPEAPGTHGKVFSQYKLAPGEACPNNKFLAWIFNTPYMNKIELDFALAAIEGEHLGQDSTTDLLSISLSVNDFIGHAYGPYSPEVADTVLRTDRYLADFFASLDREVGLDNVWIILTADHGVAPTPAYAKQHGLGQGLAQPDAVRRAIESALTEAFGQDQWVEYAEATSFCLNEAALKRHQVEAAKAQAVAAEAAASVPGVYAAFTRQQLLSGAPLASPYARKAANCFYGQRSGDVFVVFNPYVGPSISETGAGHGSPWNYDAQVPLVLWGAAFRPGTYSIPCQPIDLAATLAAALAISQPSGTQGQPLVQALK